MSNQKASFAAAASQMWNQNSNIIGNKGFSINLKADSISDEKSITASEAPKTGFVFGANLTSRAAKAEDSKAKAPQTAAEILQSFTKKCSSTGFTSSNTTASTSSGDWLTSPKETESKIENEEVEKPITGEEDERNVFQAACKIFQYDPEAKIWRERGPGNVRLNENNDFEHDNPARSRLVARSSGSQKVLINSPLFYEMVFEAVSEKRIKISAKAPDTDVPQLFLIQATPALIGQLKDLLRQRLKKIETCTPEAAIPRKRKASENEAEGDTKRQQNGNSGKREKDGTEASGEDSTNESEDYDS